MYYQNITHPELQEYHKVIVPNFTIKLTDALTSNLFKVETIITDSIYKVYPLFYTMEITSSNPLDKILETQCIICQKTTNETYLTFISNPDDPIKDYSNYASYFDVSDTLTTAEFNSLVSLLRRNVIHNENIKINDVIVGDYGVYCFDISDVTVLDTGIVVTDETIIAEPKVKLSNPTFLNSTYTLQLKVLHYTDVNILDEDTDDYKVVETLEVELVNGEWVNIPVTDLSEGYVILFDANVEIKHDKSIIQDWITQLFLTGDKPIIQSGDSETLTATALDDLGNGVDGKTIYFVQKSKHFIMDIGTTAKHNDIWSFRAENCSLTRNTDYTVIQETSTTNMTVYTDLEVGATIEFDVYGDFENSAKSAYFMYMYNTDWSVGNGVSFSQINANVKEWTPIRIKVNSNNYVITNLNTGDSATRTLSSECKRFAFFGGGDITKIRFRNFISTGDIISSATTSNGVATNNITGVGYGLIKNVARFNDLESNEYEFLDALFKDMGTSDYSTTGWTNARMTLTRPNNEYTQLVWTGSSNSGAYYRDFTLGGSLCIEFDLNFKKATSSSEIVAIDSNWTLLGKISKSNSNLAEDTWHHIKIQLNGAIGTIKNDTNDTVISFDCTNANRFIFSCNNANDVVRYRNFVIYKPSRVEPTSVALTGSSSVIQTGDTLTLSAKATSSETGVCTGNRIDFIQKPTSSNTWTQIGSALTDETGTAKLNYTGTGSGDVDFKAKYQQLQSEPYPVLDCAFTDMVDSVSNTKWWNNGGNIGITTSNGVKVLTTNTSNCQYRPATEQTTDSTKVVTFAPSVILEIEITEITGSWVLQTYDGNVNQNPYISATGKYKIVYDGSTAKYYKDDSDTPFSQKSGFTGLNVNLGLQCWSSGQTLKYKNFKIYPI